MLDKENLVKQRDPSGALQVATRQFDQLSADLRVQHETKNRGKITNLVVAGMGGSALAALLAQVWLKDDIQIPFAVVRGYELPSYADENTLVILSSYSGNTEETLRVYDQAMQSGTQVGIVTSGGKLSELSNTGQLPHVLVPANVQPRLATLYMLHALTKLLASFGIIESQRLNELFDTSEWLDHHSSAWQSAVATEHNLAKQLALQVVGKTAMIYGGELTAPLAYKWKISWNENAKNLAFWNQYPEANHNEFIGWTSHPVEKPFAVIDLVSNHESQSVLKRFELSDRLLSGRRPKAMQINLEGETVLRQLLWGCVLADFTSIYLAILNNVDPTPVELIERLKAELND